MVFVWSYLTDGDPAYTLVQVSVNDLIMLVLFAPLVAFLVSAGTHPVGLNPYAVTVVGEAGVDISHHVSERVDPYLNQTFDYVITVCDRAQETCPIFPGASKTLHWNFDDPAKATGTDEQKLIVFRKSRDEIADRVRHFLAEGL